MFSHRDPSGYSYRTYQIDAGSFKLNEGDMVQPGTEIGLETSSHTKIISDYWGYVATAYYNTMNDSFLVMVCQEINIDGMLSPEKLIHVVRFALN